jgi:hypothetical protein
LLQLKCDFGGHLPDLIPQVRQIVIDFRGVRGEKDNEQHRPAG